MSRAPRLSARAMVTLAVVLAAAGVALLWPRAAPHSPPAAAPSATGTAPTHLASTPPRTSPPSTEPPSSAPTSSSTGPSGGTATSARTGTSTLDPLAGDLDPARALQLLRRSYPAHASTQAGRGPVTAAWAALEADLERGGYRRPALLAGILTPAHAGGGTQTVVLMWSATSPAGDDLSEQVSAVTVRVSGSRTVVVSLDGSADTP